MDEVNGKIRAKLEIRHPDTHEILWETWDFLINVCRWEMQEIKPIVNAVSEQQLVPEYLIVLSGKPSSIH
jgi:hypothetical protein